MTSGETNFASAFNVADYHVAEENFFSIWIPPFYDDGIYPPKNPQNAKLDDNGDGIGHDYNLSPLHNSP